MFWTDASSPPQPISDTREVGRLTLAVNVRTIRKAAIKYKIPYVTTLSAALASAKGIEATRDGRYGVKSLQAYHHEVEPR